MSIQEANLGPVLMPGEGPMLGIEYLRLDNPKHARRSAYAHRLITVAMQTYFKPQLREQVPAVPLSPDFMKIPNIHKAYCLGKTAVSLGADNVGVVDLGLASEQSANIYGVMNTFTEKDTQLVILAEPELSIAADPGHVREITGIFASKDHPTLLVGRNALQVVGDLETAMLATVPPTALDAKLAHEF